MPDASELAARVITGDSRTASRLISMLEREDDVATEAVSLLFPRTGSARSIGVTGPPGAGKSTLVKGLIDAYRARGFRVGVLAIDPSSRRTGGALLGDRLGMASHDGTDQVFIRSMAVRNQHGGIARDTTQALRVLDAMGFDRLLVETVGVGQSEVDVAEVVDCTVLVSHPGAGDEIQAMKSGVMEIGDLYLVNKADQPGAEHVRRQLLSAVRLLESKDPPRQVLMASARTGEGVEALVEVIEVRLEHLSSTGLLQQNRWAHLQREVLQLVLGRSVAQALVSLGPDPVAAYAEDLQLRRLDPSAVASLLLATDTSAQPAEPSTQTQASSR